MKLTPVLVGSVSLFVGIAATLVAQSPPSPHPVAAPIGLPTLPQPGAAPTPTIDQVLNELEKVRAQKAELDRKEKELAATAKELLAAISRRAGKLGVTEPEVLIPTTMPSSTAERMSPLPLPPISDAAPSNVPVAVPASLPKK